MRQRPRQALLDELDGVERGDRTFARLFLARGDREYERVEQEIGRGDAVLVDANVVDALGDIELPLRSVGLAHFINGKCHERGAVLFGERHHLVEFLAAVFEVDRVDDRLAGAEFERRLDDVDLGRVDHNRLRQDRVVALQNFLHVAHFVAADVRHAHIENMHTFALLLARHI